MYDEYDGWSQARIAIEIIRIANHVIGLLDSAAGRHMARMRDGYGGGSPAEGFGGGSAVEII